MKALPIKDLRPGMVVTEPIYTNSGQRILDADSVLTGESIYRLSFYNISSVKVKKADENGRGEQYTAMIPNPSRVSNPSYSQKVKAQPEFMKYQIEYIKLINSIREVFDTIITQ